MKKCSILILMILIQTLYSISLKEVYEAAPASAGFDKYLELETGQIYTGGLLIGKILDPISYELEGEEGQDVRIKGNGAILDLQGKQICISYCDNKLDIDDCIIINGNIRYRGINAGNIIQIPTGFVRYITFYRSHDYGVRLQGSGEDILLERNIVVDAVNTGYDYIYTHGISSDWLPTGASFGISIQYGFYGIPDVIDNWSFHSDEEINADLLNHFVLLCEYG
ncbi:MAG: hypothetical protein HQ534_06400 [Armatimonadetes bacterium]|nr:hypothetical protein [Armatimonadota bacterium]